MAMMQNIYSAVSGVAIVVLLIVMIVFFWHFFGPQAAAWIHANREEKMVLSKNKIFGANGYMIHSGSDIFLSSSGSFKRFDSIDGDYHQMGQSSLSSPPPWQTEAPVPIPPQPLRPAPAPLPHRSVENINEIHAMKQPLKHQSSEVAAPNCISIPRPIARRQMSSPVPSTAILPAINTAGASCHKLCAGAPMSGPAVLMASTNPFRNGAMNTTEAMAANIERAEAATFRNALSTIEGSVMAPPPQSATAMFSFNAAPLDGSFCGTRKLDDALRKAEGSIRKLERASQVYLTNGNRGDVHTRMPRPRSRSQSETDTIMQTIDGGRYDDPFDCVDKCVPPLLHKTLSETFLQQVNSSRANNHWAMSKNLGRQWSRGSASFSSQGSFDTESASYGGGCDSRNGLSMRAMSSESVSSESSVLVSDLVEPLQLVASGHLCIGLRFEKSTCTSEGVELTVMIIEAKELYNPHQDEPHDTYVNFYIKQDQTTAAQTKTFKSSACPSFNETFSFWLPTKREKYSILFNVYHSGNSHTLIGEAEIQLSDVTRPITTWLPLCDSRKNLLPCGELMFSLSYLPTAERLTVVVVKGRNLQADPDASPTPNCLHQNFFVKVYLLKGNKKVSKKRTSVKRDDCSVVFNESMLFSVPPYMLRAIQIRLSVVCANESVATPNVVAMPCRSFGHVIVGTGLTGKSLRHWHEMLSTLRKPVAMWHPLRRTNARTNQK